MKKYILVLFVLSVIFSGCRPAVMHFMGKEQAKEDIDTQIEKAVKQLVSTMRPIYRDYQKYREIHPLPIINDDGSETVTKYNKSYNIDKKNGEYKAVYLSDGNRVDDLGKIRLAILDTSNLSETFDNFWVSETNSIIMEKVLANVFLQEEISKNFMVLERLAYDDLDEPADEEDEKNPGKEDPSGYVDVTDELKNGGAKSEEKSDFTTSRALTFFTKIARRFKDVDVILVGFLVEEKDYHELHLRMIETSHGQIVAVGTSRIKREFIDGESEAWQ